MLIKRMLFILCLWILQTSHAAIILGNPEGKMVVTEVFDYQCPHCHRMEVTIERFITQHPDIKFKLIPVAMMNKLSMVQAAMMIDEANQGQQFIKLHQTLMQSPPMNTKQFKAFLDRHDIQSNKSWQSHAVEAQFEEGVELMQQYDLHEVPILIFENKTTGQQVILKGEQSLQVLEYTLKQLQGNI